MPVQLAVKRDRDRNIERERDMAEKFKLGQASKQNLLLRSPKASTHLVYGICASKARKFNLALRIFLCAVIGGQRPGGKVASPELDTFSSNSNEYQRD